MQETMLIPTADSDALTRLVDELQKSKADLEAKRHTETLLARLISLMRWRNEDTLEIWTDRLLDELVLAVDGLQASLYLYEKSGGDELLHLIGVYAYDKNKMRKSIPLGEGIIGQVAKSRRASYFGAETSFESFTATSIAQVKPRALRVQPLIYNESLAGVLEISSIREIGHHETEFLLQISENIAANLLNISSQEETRRLYHEMQLKSEALVSQEEEMRQNVEELQATQEEMRRVQFNLKEEADRTRILLESMRDAVITIEKGRFLECNGAALRIFGCESREEFLGKGWADFSATAQSSGRATSEEIPDRLVYAMNDGGTSFEWKAKRRNGEEFDSEIYLSPFDYQGGTLLLMVVRDISEQKRSEARLMEQQQQMQIAQSIARMGSWQLDLRTKNTLWSDSMYQIFNVSPEAGPLDYDTITQMTYFEDRDAFKQSYTDLVMYGTRSNLEYRIMPRGGDVKWVRTDGFAVRNDKGDIIKVYGLVQDITEQKEKEIEVTEKNNELAARESELQKALKRSTSLFNNAGDAIIILKEGLIDDINPAGLRLFGYASREQMLSEAVTHFCPKEQNDQLSLELFEAQLAELEKKREVIFELKIKRANEQIRDCEFRITKLVFDDQELQQLIVRDITEKKIQDKEIARQKMMLDAVMNCNADNVMLIDTDFKVQLANKVFRDFYASLGHDLSPGRSIFDFVNPDQKEAYQKRFERALNGESHIEETFYTFEDVATHSEVSRFPVFDEEGKVFGIGIVSRDITQRKLQEQEILNMNNRLMAQEEEMRQNMEEMQATQEQMRETQKEILEQQLKTQAIIDGSADNIVLFNPDFTVALANRNFINWYKQNGADLRIGDNIFSYITPEEEQGYKQVFNNALAGKSFTFEKEYTFNNKTSIFELDVFPAKDVNGTVMGIGLITREITDRKRHEEELRQNMEELQATQEQMRQAQKVILEQQLKTQAIIDGSGDNIFLINPDYTIAMANANFTKWYKQFGADVKVGDNIFDYVNSDEEASYKQFMTGALNGRSYTFEKDYTFKNVKSVFEYDVFPARDVDGKVIGIGFVTRDISERKRQERELMDMNGELMAQSEELRQNMEELHATQEQMRKAQIELEVQQQKTQAIIDGSTDNIMLINTNFVLELANENTIKFYKAANIDLQVGDNLFNVIAANEHDNYRQLFQSVLAGNSHTFETEYNFKSISGFFDVAFFPAKDISGKIIGIGIVSGDISERKKQEALIVEQNEKLNRQSATLNQIVNALPFSIFWKDREGRYLGYNKPFLQTIAQNFPITGDDMLIGITDDEMPWAEMAAATWPEYVEVMETGAANVHQEEQIVMEGLPDMWMRMSKIPLQNDKKESFGVVGIFEDITERKHQERQLLDMNSELRAQEEELRQNMEELQATQDQMRKAQENLVIQQQKTQAIIDGSPDNIMLINADLQVEVINSHMTQYYQDNGVELTVGTNVMTILTAEEKDGYGKMFQSVLAGNSHTVETDRVVRDSKRSTLVSIYPTKDAKGKIFGIGIISKDISDLKKKERELLDMNNELHAQEEELRQNMEELQATQDQMRKAQLVILEQQLKTQAIIDGSSDYIALYNADFTLTMANQNYFRWYKQNGVEIQLGENIFKYVTPEETDGYMQIFKGALAGNATTVEQEYTFNNKVSIFAYDFFPAKDSTGSVMGVGMVAREITESKRQERQLMDMNSELRAQEEELRQNMEELQATQDQMRKAQLEIVSQQQKTQAIIDGCPDNIVLFSPDYSVEVANSSFIKWFKQFGVDIHVGENMFNYISAEEKAGYQQVFDTCLAGQALKIEQEYSFQDKKFYFDFNFFPAKDATGKIIGIGNVARDITQRKIQEREMMDMNSELRAQEEELRQNMEELQATQDQMRIAQQNLETQHAVLNQIVNALPLSIFWKDRQGRYLGYNKPFLMSAAQNASITDDNMLIGKTDADMPWAEASEALWHEYVEVMDSGKAQINKEEHILMEGMPEMWLRLSKIPLHDEKGKTFGVIGLFEDVSPQKKTEQQIMETNQLLRRQTVILNQIVNALPLSIFWKDRQGIYLGYNKPFLFSVAQSVSVTNEDMLIGKSDAEMPWAEVAAATWHEYTAVMDSGKAEVNKEEQILMEGMPEMWLRMSKIPLKDEKGDTFGVIGMYEDITASKVKG